MKRLQGVTVAVALVGASVSLALPGTAAQSAETSAGTINWTSCEEPQLEGLECGTVSVPIDHDDPAGTEMDIAVSRMQHDPAAGTYEGVMLVNPGGPGAPGRSLATLGMAVPDGVGARYDWIGFDPRGVGASEHALHCDEDYPGWNRTPYALPGGTSISDEIEQSWLASADGYAKACAERNALLLPHMRTEDAVRDMDLIRQALDADKIDYFGFSYGTYLGQVYRSIFPAHVDRMVLDGVMDGRQSYYDGNLAQGPGFETNLKAFFAWMAKHHAVYQLGKRGTDVEKRWYAEQAKLAAAPIALAYPEGALVGPAEFTDVFLAAGYAEFLWPYLGAAFANWATMRDSEVLSWFVMPPGDDNLYAVYSAVGCTDSPWPGWDETEADNIALAKTAPFLAWSNAWFNAPCLTWGAKAEDLVPLHDGGGDLLLITQEHDAATPAAGAFRTREVFGGARLLVEPGGRTHSGSLFGNPCTDGLIATYLAEGVLPDRVPSAGPDVTCPTLPKPQPDHRLRTKGKVRGALAADAYAKRDRAAAARP